MIFMALRLAWKARGKKGTAFCEKTPASVISDGYQDVISAEL